MPLEILPVPSVGPHDFGADAVVGAPNLSGYASRQEVAIGGSSAQSAALPQGTHYVYLYADTPCYVTAGANPTASPSTSWPMRASDVMVFAVKDTDLIAVISA
jgi:hypothetical protein